jgi:type II secretory pathway component GspD/PulD (secretin)
VTSNVASTGVQTQTVSYVTTGIQLKVTPSINADGRITLQVNPNVSQPSATASASSTGAPAVDARTANTTVLVRDGETIVIGGLITSRRSEGQNKVPLIGDIPWLGELFKSQSYSESKTELLIVMTVDVLETDREARIMSVAERDRFVLPDRIRQSPLMEGLRIRPDEALMGPDMGSGSEGTTIPSPAPPTREGAEYDGPRPKTYGPTLPQSQPASKVQRQVFGPTVVRNDAPIAE